MNKNDITIMNILFYIFTHNFCISNSFKVSMNKVGFLYLRALYQVVIKTSFTFKELWDMLIQSIFFAAHKPNFDSSIK